MQVVASDFQESKNINTDSDSPLPNTRFQGIRAEAVNRPTVTWVTPGKGRCLVARQQLLVVANDNVQISSVGFFDGNRQIGRVLTSMDGAQRRGVPDWADVDRDACSGRIKILPSRNDITMPINEKLIVELYSK